MNTWIILIRGINEECMMVRAAGLEPALPYGNKILSLACLPIPPRPHLCVGFGQLGGNMANYFFNAS